LFLEKLSLNCYYYYLSGFLVCIQQALITFLNNWTYLFLSHKNLQLRYFTLKNFCWLQKYRYWLFGCIARLCV
jgi:hypothetical protein